METNERLEAEVRHGMHLGDFLMRIFEPDGLKKALKELENDPVTRTTTKPQPEETEV